MKRLLFVLAVAILSGSLSWGQNNTKIMRGITQTKGTFPVPRATGKTAEPIWIEQPMWGGYSMPGFWQCPVGYIQRSKYGTEMSASKNGEISGGSEDFKEKPSCYRETSDLTSVHVKSMEHRWASEEEIRVDSCTIYPCFTSFDYRTLPAVKKDCVESPFPSPISCKESWVLDFCLLHGETRVIHKDTK